MSVCLLALSALIGHVVGECRGYKIKSPCTFSDGPGYCDIHCTGGDKIDLKAIFNDLSSRLPADRKPFRELVLESKAIEELPANAFSGIQFTSINISNGDHIKRVNVGAFDGTASTITKLSLHYAPVTELATDESDLFGAIDTLKALETFQMLRTGVQSFPSLALSGHRKLTHIYVYQNPLKSISANAFTDLPALRVLLFDGNTGIERVADHAFTVGPNSSDHSLDLLFDAQLNNPFADRAFESIGCATSIRFGLKSLKYLTSDEFNAFFSENPMNTVIDLSIDCADSLNQWIREKYPKVWHDLNCK
ncbi:unnamed protein product [Medioppia subpectinata]|uniref:Oplophorus-luciferin 2-monooxygenase non-catalytic subunit n=1 Tax=Medioppia subpectinata TaxID=1979941 RepID=A0A7R9Q2G9_9ACAR|nr:unnamed protein product [Medioppia subpectinata]CAG2110353.1 unnamed protein product [Medioppia subpectinata]